MTASESTSGGRVGRDDSGTEPARALAVVARQSGLHAVLGGPGCVGMADPGALRVSGPDAAAWLHTCVTNVVEGLAPGQGNVSARVDRSGRLQHWFTLHAVSDGFLLVLPRSEVADLLADLDRYLFAEQVTLSDASDGPWCTVQGPLAAAVLTEVFGDHAFATLTDGASVEIDGVRVLRRSLGGDVGFLVQGDRDLTAAARTVGVTCVAGPAFSDALEVLRVEAGLPLVGAETAGSKLPLLPELGLEQHAVSYSKGCYLGQEVIARVRTYGKLPRALRALVLRDVDLARLPAVGDDVVVDGAVVGRWLSRVWSPVAGAPVALASLAREHRTPGDTLVVDVAGATARAEVALLPLYRADDDAARARHLYEKAIRVFATGDAETALELLQAALRAEPSHADAYEALGVILGRTGRFHEAIDFFQRLEEIAPHEPMVNTNLSLYYMKLGDKTTAEAHSAKALGKSMARGRTDGRTAVDVAKDMAAAREKDARRKREMFSMVLEIDPDDPIALYGLGNALSALGDWEGAEKAYAHACTVQADNSAVWLGWGRALEALERRSDALVAYRSGMAVASRRGDLMPLKEMEQRALLLQATAGE